MADALIPCSGRNCKRQMRPRLADDTDPQGWYWTGAPGVERRDLECDHPSEFHLKTEMRKAKEKAK